MLPSREHCKSVLDHVFLPCHPLSCITLYLLQRFPTIAPACVSELWKNCHGYITFLLLQDTSHVRFLSGEPKFAATSHKLQGNTCCTFTEQEYHLSQKHQSSSLNINLNHDEQKFSYLHLKPLLPVCGQLRIESHLRKKAEHLLSICLSSSSASTQRGKYHGQKSLGQARSLFFFFFFVRNPLFMETHACFCLYSSCWTSRRVPKMQCCVLPRLLALGQAQSCTRVFSCCQNPSSFVPPLDVPGKLVLLLTAASVARTIFLFLFPSHA